MDSITWKIYCKSSSDKIFRLLTTPEGRESFWSESAPLIDNQIHFGFPNDEKIISDILSEVRNTEFIITYFGTVVKFELREPNEGGTIVTLINSDVPEHEYIDMKAGWVSVLLNLKSVADFGVDLRNHDPEKTWTQHFADN